MTEPMFRSDMTVQLVVSEASDHSVTRSARVSTLGNLSALTESVKRERGLILYLMKNRHGSPFEHNLFTFYIEAPIFVWREFMRHRIGVSYNEESGRYRELQPVFYVTSDERLLVQTGKPGAYEFVPGTPAMVGYTQSVHREAARAAYHGYESLLRMGVAKEVARMSLPLSIYSGAYVTMNARSLMSFLSLRTQHDEAKFPSKPQAEIEMVAVQMEAFFREAMPLTYEAFNLSGRVAP